MKQVIFRYGIFAALAIVVLSAVHFFILMPNASFETSEVAGYLTMILAMIFVFLGIRYYRDHVNGGFLSFGQGLKIGVLIVLIPAVSFGLFDVLYTEVINPGWSESYLNHYVAKIKANTAPDKVEAELKKLRDNMDMFSNPVIQFLLMAVTVFIIGFIATILSTLTLMRKKKTAIA